MNKKILLESVENIDKIISYIESDIEEREHEKYCWIQERKQLLELISRDTNEICPNKQCQYRGFNGDCIKEAFGIDISSHPIECIKLKEYK